MLLLEKLTNPRKIALVGNINNQNDGIIISRNIRNSSVKRSIFRIMGHDSVSMQGLIPSVPNFPVDVDIAVISSNDPDSSRYLEICDKNDVPYVFLLASSDDKNVKTARPRRNFVDSVHTHAKCKVFGPDSRGICDSRTDLNLSMLENEGSHSSNDKLYALVSVDCSRHPIVVDEFKSFRSDLGFLIDFGSGSRDSEILASIGSYLQGREEISALALLTSENECSNGDVITPLRANFSRPIIVYREKRELKTNSPAENGKRRRSTRKSLPIQDCIVAKDLYDVPDFARVIALNPVMRGNKVSVISTKGGTESVAQDYLTSGAFGMQLQVPHLGLSTKAKLTNLLGNGYSSHNPVTLGPKERMKIGNAIETVMSDRNTDAILTLVSPDSYDLIHSFIYDLDPEKMKKPMVVAIIGSGSYQSAFNELSGRKFAVYPSIRRAITALKALASYSLNNSNLIDNSRQV
jgi:acyl-CoA synthetase (NDP forming)